MKLAPVKKIRGRYVPGGISAVAWLKYDCRSCTYYREERCLGVYSVDGATRHNCDAYSAVRP